MCISLFICKDLKIRFPKIRLHVLQIEICASLSALLLLSTSSASFAETNDFKSLISTLNSSVMVNHDCSSLRGYNITPYAMTEEVLDTYMYFYCYADANHDRPLWLPTYKTITFSRSYTRLYPDEEIDTWPCPCPFNKLHRGEMHSFKCRYKLIS